MPEPCAADSINWWVVSSGSAVVAALVSGGVQWISSHLAGKRDNKNISRAEDSDELKAINSCLEELGDKCQSYWSSDQNEHSSSLEMEIKALLDKLDIRLNILKTRGYDCAQQRMELRTKATGGDFESVGRVANNNKARSEIPSAINSLARILHHRFEDNYRA